MDRRQNDKECAATRAEKLNDIEYAQTGAVDRFIMPLK